jgi:GxxExxY protein
MFLTKTYLNDLTYEINGAIIEVHKTIGPGLLEKIYHQCLAKEFSLRGINYISEMNIMINYKGVKLNSELRCDFLVEDAIVFELKAVEKMNPIFQTVIMTYMNLTQKPKGILVNFTVQNIMKEGHQTFVNEIFRELDD